MEVAISMSISVIQEVGEKQMKPGSSRVPFFAAALVMILAGGNPLYAQDEQDNIEEVVVYATPYSDSERVAQGLQRASRIPVNIVAADSIGRFPDQNVAASLSRLPGIAVERDQGQERLISIRGPSRWTSLAMNGTNVITSAAGGSAGSRAVRFDTIPNAIVSRIEVYKAVSPDMPGETVSGRANIITRSAFDHQGFFGSFDGGYGITDLEDNDQYDVQGAISTTFGGDDQFGIVISGSRYSRDQRTNNIEQRFRPGCSLEQDSGCESRVFPRRSEFRTYDLVRENTSGTVRLEFRNDDHYLFANAVYTEFVDDEDLYRYSVRYDRGSVGLTEGGNTPDGGFAPSARVRPTLWITPRGEENQLYGIGGEHTLGNDLGVDWGVSYADTSSFDSLQTMWWQFRPVDILYSLADPDLPTAVITQPGTSVPITQADLDSAPAIIIEGLTTTNETDAFDVHLDLEKEISDSVTLKTGFRYVTREQTNYRQAENVVDFAGLANAGIDTGMAQFTTGEPLDGFPRDFQAERLDFNALSDFIFEITGNPDLSQAASAGSNSNNVRGYEVEEDILAGYIMGTFEAPWGSVVGGVRVEYAENTGSSNAFINGVITPFTFDQSETNVLPSIYVNYDLNDEMKLRLSVSKGIARPNFDVLSGRFVVDDANMTISGGNPDIDSEEILSFELNYEWYFDDDLGLFAASVFHKDITNPFFSQTLPFASDILNTEGIDRSDYDLTSTANGDSGALTGLELSVYKKLQIGFGVSASYSVLWGEFTTPAGRDVDLPDTSDNIANISLFYENYGWSARINYQYRDDWLAQLGGESFDLFWNGEARLSTQVQYAINDTFTIYFEGNNLTDDDGLRYRGFRDRVYEREEFGRRFLLGVRGTFF